MSLFRASASTALVERFRLHARSFSWASSFLGDDVNTPIHRLYHFCRTVDDLIDETDDLAASDARVATFAEHIEAGESDIPLVQDFLELSATHGINRQAALYLIKGVRQDGVQTTYETLDDLLHYCYYVGGTVGLMMAPLLGVRNERNYSYAVDLGIGMQLTNIVRDVYEDASRGRVYLPQELMEASPTPEEILRGSMHTRQAVFRAKAALVSYAHTFYRSGGAGIPAIAKEHQIGITIASHVYEAIGWKVVLRPHRYYNRRAYLGAIEKSIVTLGAAGIHHIAQTFGTEKPTYGEPLLHRSHRMLEGLPGLSSVR